MISSELLTRPTTHCRTGRPAQVDRAHVGAVLKKDIYDTGVARASRRMQRRASTCRLRVSVYVTKVEERRGGCFESNHPELVYVAGMGHVELALLPRVVDAVDVGALF